MRKRSLILALVFSLGFGAVSGCAKGADKVDFAKLQAGKSHSARLKFWRLDRALIGNDLVPVVHFDDGANQRLMLTFAPEFKDKIGKLKQGAVVKVTFNAKAGDGIDKINKGQLTAIE